MKSSYITESIIEYLKSGNSEKDYEIATRKMNIESDGSIARVECGRAARRILKIQTRTGDIDKNDLR